MPGIEVYEFYESRKTNTGWDSATADLVFVLNGTSDDALAREKFYDVFPLSFYGLLFRNADIEPIGGLFWKAVAHYDSKVTSSQDYPGVPGGTPGGDPNPGNPPPRPGDNDPLGPEFSMEISAHTEKVYQSKGTRHKIKRGGGVAPDTKKAIGITQDGEVEGCDRLSPHMEWGVTRIFGFVSLAYMQQLYKMIGTTNHQPFYGHEVGTQLFIGASMNIKQPNKVVISYRFAARPNETEIEICDGLIVPDKFGWEYLWVSYTNTIDAGELTMQPKAAYVEAIYSQSDFSKIGIGV